MRGYVLSGLAFVAILVVLVAAFTELVTLTGLTNPVEGSLAFAPGGQAEIMGLAQVAARLIGIGRPASWTADLGNSTGSSRLLHRVGLAAA